MMGRLVLTAVNGLAFAIPLIVGFYRISDDLLAHPSAHAAVAYFLGVLAGLYLTLSFVVWSSAIPKPSGENR